MSQSRKISASFNSSEPPQKNRNIMFYSAGLGQSVSAVYQHPSDVTGGTAGSTNDGSSANLAYMPVRGIARNFQAFTNANVATADLHVTLNVNGVDVGPLLVIPVGQKEAEDMATTVSIPADAKVSVHTPTNTSTGFAYSNFSFEFIPN